MMTNYLIFYISSFIFTFGYYKSERTTEKAIGNCTNSEQIAYYGISPELSLEVEDMLVEKENFEQTVQSSSYIDKTLFIRALLDLPRYLVITGPRGFSKTTNLNMLKSFFEHELDEKHRVKESKLSKKLDTFKDKNIFADEKFFWRHFAKYPIIHIDLSLVKAQSFDKFLRSFIKYCIDPLVAKFGYLLNSTDVRALSDAERSRYVKGYQWTKDELQDFGADLAGLLHQHHGTKPILLIDEYDTPIVTAFLETNVPETDAESILQFLGTIVAKMIKQNHDTFRAVLTGCLAVKLEYDYFGGKPIPNLQYLTIFESKEMYSAYGFLETDLDELEKRFAIAPTEMDVIRLYYRGYSVFEKIEDTILARQLKSTNLTIFNTQSLLHSLRKRAVDQCWSGGLIKKLRPILGAEKWGPTLEECMLRRCEIEVKGPMKKTNLLQLKKSLLSPKNPDCGHFIFQLFLEAGYFTVEERRGFSHIIIAPNFEVQTVMMDEFYRSKYLSTRYNFTMEDERNYVTSLDRLSTNVTSLESLVGSVRKLFQNLEPKDETFMLAVLLYPLLNSSEFASFRIEQYSSLSSRYAIFAKRWRDHAGIMFDLRTGPLGLQNLDQETHGPLSIFRSDVFKQFPDLKDTVDLRLVANAKNDIYGFYNYTVFNGNFTLKLWPPLNITHVENGTR